MFCWEARQAMDRGDAGWIVSGERRRLHEHFGRCAACREERARRDRLTGLVREAGRVASPAAPDGFEMAVLRAARARAAARPAPAAGAWLRPLPAAAALLVVVAATTLALVGGAPRGAGTAVTAEFQEDLNDGIAPPAQIPFTIQEDLVGEHRGTIPLTTYVLEPAPAERAPVMRASL
jgi:hypothetical protein